MNNLIETILNDLHMKIVTIVVNLDSYQGKLVCISIPYLKTSAKKIYFRPQDIVKVSIDSDENIEIALSCTYHEE